MSGEFVDTNVLVYAFDTTAAAKHDQAKALVERLLDEQKGLVSTQVLAELLVTLTRKVARPVPVKAAIEIVEDLATWPVFVPSPPDLVAAALSAERYRVHFWDSLIIRAAHCLDAQVLWSEDLNPGQRYEGVEVRNPFAPPRAMS
jgi:predicted nucleic acid-binding protein